MMKFDERVVRVESVATEDLEDELEGQRRLYEPAYTFTNLFAWSDTVWKKTLTSIELYLIMAIYVGCLVYRELNPDDVSELSNSVKSTIANLSTALIFLLTFLISQSYNRYDSIWQCTQTAYGRVNDLNVLLPAYMDENPAARDTVIRLVNAYHQTVYMANAGVQKDDICRILKAELLITFEECDKLIKQDCSTQMRILIWATQIVKRSGINPYYVCQINEYIIMLRRNLAYLWSYDDQPVPFMYYHIVNVMVIVVLILQSISNGSGQPISEDESAMHLKITSLLAQALYVCVVIALRELAISFFDPFNEGEIPATRYMRLLVSGSSKLSNYNDDLPEINDSDRFGQAYKLQAYKSETVKPVDIEGRRKVMTRLLNTGMHHKLKQKAGIAVGKPLIETLSKE